MHVVKQAEISIVFFKIIIIIKEKILIVYLFRENIFSIQETLLCVPMILSHFLLCEEQYIFIPIHNTCILYTSLHSHFLLEQLYIEER